MKWQEVIFVDESHRRLWIGFIEEIIKQQEEANLTKYAFSQGVLVAQQVTLHTVAL